MHINVGDLVSFKHNKTEDEKSLGIVVKKFKSHIGLEKSFHIKHIIDSYPPVFYVYSFDGSFGGPYLRSELSLQQTYAEDSIL